MAVAAFTSIAGRAESGMLHRRQGIGDRNNELDVGVSKLFKATAAFVKAEAISIKSLSIACQQPKRTGSTGLENPANQTPCSQMPSEDN